MLLPSRLKDCKSTLNLGHARFEWMGIAMLVFSGCKGEETGEGTRRGESTHLTWRVTSREAVPKSHIDFALGTMCCRTTAETRMDKEWSRSRYDVRVDSRVSCPRSVGTQSRSIGRRRPPSMWVGIEKSFYEGLECMAMGRSGFDGKFHSRFCPVTPRWTLTYYRIPLEMTLILLKFHSPFSS